MISFKKTVTLGGIALLFVIAMVFWNIFSGEKHTAKDSPGVSQGHEAHQHVSDETAPAQKKRKIKYWVAPMDPTYIRDKPGKSPMGMDLVPVYEDEEELDKNVIKIDPVVVQNIGVRTAKAIKDTFYATIRTVGHITYDEKRVRHIHTKISGWVERLFVETTGEQVNKGEELLSIYSPELVATQEEYLQALNYREKVAVSSFEDVAKGADTLLESTRKRLLLMDIDPDQIKALEERGEVEKNMILHSPTTGIVIKKHVFEGMEVDPGMELYTIADLSRVWAIASVYEYELPFLEVGLEAEMCLPYEPGVVYKGRINFIYPYLSSKTRTVQVRMEFENPALKLKPNMYADVVIKTKISDEAILLPSESVIRTGLRNVVITSLGKGKFLPKEIVIGKESEGFVQVLSGLDEGETVVTSGQFLIDSESNLREAINKMLEAKGIEKTEPELHDMEKMHKMDMEMSPRDKH